MRRTNARPWKLKFTLSFEAALHFPPLTTQPRNLDCESGGGIAVAWHRGVRGSGVVPSSGRSRSQLCPGATFLAVHVLLPRDTPTYTVVRTISPYLGAPALTGEPARERKLRERRFPRLACGRKLRRGRSQPRRLVKLTGSGSSRRADEPPLHYIPDRTAGWSLKPTTALNRHRGYVREFLQLGFEDSSRDRVTCPDSCSRRIDTDNICPSCGKQSQLCPRTIYSSPPSCLCSNLFFIMVF